MVFYNKVINKTGTAKNQQSSAHVLDKIISQIISHFSER